MTYSVVRNSSDQTGIVVKSAEWGRILVFLSLDTSRLWVVFSPGNQADEKTMYIPKHDLVGCLKRFLGSM